MSVLNIAVIGSTYVLRQRTGEFQVAHTSTNMRTSSYVPYDASIGLIDVNYIEKPIATDTIDGVLLFFDVTNQARYNLLGDHLATVNNLYGAVPVVVCSKR